MRDFCKLAVCAFLLKQDAVFISYGAFHSVRTCLQRPGAPMGLMTLYFAVGIFLQDSLGSVKEFNILSEAVGARVFMAFLLR